MASKVLEPAFQGVGQKVYPYSLVYISIPVTRSLYKYGFDDIFSMCELMIYLGLV